MKAFSLVELSIVLVILGLLVGGILAGQSLIHASELRSYMNQQQNYLTAMMAFRDKYFGFPGDITNATAFWGKDNTNCSSHTGTAATPGTCNGNGNGLVLMNNSEALRYWQQLTLAGLIEGNYTGTGTTTSIGTNTPASKLSNVGFSFGYWTYFNRSMFVNGADSGQLSSLQYSGFTPEDAWNIDQKIDDGLSDTGRIWANAGSNTNTTINCKHGSPLAYAWAEKRVACYLMHLVD